MPISFDNWLLFTATEAALSLAPGPAVMLVVATALAQGRRASAWITLGILLANAIYFAISATGLGSLLMASTTLFLIVKWVGAGYLMVLGLLALFGQPSPISLTHLHAHPAAARQLFLNGLLLQLANPKALLTFIALLPQFINPAAPIAPQMLILAASSMAPESLILLGYGLLASRAKHWLQRPGYARKTEQIGGAMLLVVGIALASV